MQKSAPRYSLLLCMLLIAMALVRPAPVSAAGFQPALASALDQVLDRALAGSRASGALLAVAVPGQGIWAGARGLADRDSGAALAPDDRFCIASISKTFVATIAMQLVQEGWLSLDQTVEHWLPGMIPNGQRINVRQLLNHTSGIRDYLDEPFMRAVLANPGRVWQPQELVAAAVGQPPYFAPGARGRWHYSNTNYVMLGLVIEQVTHHPLAIEIHQRIIDPLALRHTFFEPADTPDGALMQGYEGRRNLSAGLNMSFAWSVGNITSTTADLARFAEALFGGALLRPTTLATMRTFVGVAGAWGTRDLTYGLGIMQNVLHSAQPALVVGHTGELAGYRSAMWYWPERGITLVAAINQESANPNELIVKAIDALRTHLPDP